MMKRIAVIGYGAIAKDVLKALQALIDTHHIAILVHTRSALSDADLASLPTTAEVTQEPARLWSFKPDLVIEAAGQAAVAQYVPACLSAGADVLISSIGALADTDLYAELLKVAQQFQRRILLPAGAIAGLDYLQSIQGATALQVIYESHKPVAAWLPELVALGIAPASVQEPLTLFEGSAAEAAKRYPQNLNVAATLALAGIGMEQTQVRVVVDPHIQENQHHILIRSEYGEMRLQLSNTPAPSNPKSSWVVAQSIAAVVKKEFAQLRIA
ncbi:aspartate dehydrogenase [Oligella urethralis]|uniref:L-aspartate dehydrogenase n=1 Tax=Oligella urethralis DNF00040 TaxID=1401065 RepID=A0A096AIT4_9BURK|nr:aspartate dehydrogenase [Oligella urethralis]KGF30602.1 hypothetical protein HMPREF2130_06065 [Oligella urethralis DNF00040]PMC16448.1 aspartate dehydrogenase [Oligella urethralis]SUA51926.1 L-aspartate dehydrogenase [Oligella urethralis]SUA65507.1 L-aspartate dehydrogenase [Oligella urethralis]SUA68903.1 L-aspartate dehydrogenase [Oligella urethralis]